MSPQKERENTLRALDEVYAAAHRIDGFDYQKDRYVIFSDVHRCDKKGNDDFKNNDMIFCYALSVYYQKGYHLILNGDIEEGYEGNYKDITSTYAQTVYAMERKFVDENRYVRIFGNHDIDWEHKKNVNEFLAPYLGQIEAHEGVLLGNQILVLHGHQGDPHQTRGLWIGKLIVRYVWRTLQRCGLTDALWPLLQRCKLVCDRAAINNFIRRNRDQFMYEWARTNHLLLIAGHTHRAMFKSFSKIGQIQQKIDQISRMEDSLSLKYLKPALIEKLKQIIKDSKDELKDDKKANRLGDEPIPCYFNTGCCVYTNGITAIELDRGIIRLVKWEFSQATCECQEKVKRDRDFMFTIERKIYQSDNLKQILSQI